jgi:hypothetical protein
VTRKFVIDKADLRIPAHAQFSREFGPLYSYCARDPAIFRPSPHYMNTCDLRPLGFPCILHLYCTHTKAGDHKLELIDTGEMSFPQIQREILRVFDIDPGQLRLMRLDLAADVPDVAVAWFRRNARVKWKQWQSAIGTIQYSEMGRRKVETLYFGKRPNCVRIYDKISEWRHQYDQTARRSSDAAELPSFEERFGHSPGSVLTRVERQIGGGRLPKEIDRVGKLWDLEDFDPFDRIELTVRETPEPNIEDYDVMQYLTGIGLRSKVDEIGMQETRSWLNSRSQRNASRVLKQYAEFLPRDGGIDSPQLRERFRDSVRRQLAA